MSEKTSLSKHEPFDGPSFVLGSLRGLRAFNYDAEGGLHPLHHACAFTFKEGENVAACRLLKHDESLLAKANCSCGFYAYHDGSNDYYQPGANLAAVVECYGRVTLGSKGFRAEKLRILAFISPGPLSKKQVWLARAAEKVANSTLWFPLLFAMTFVSGITSPIAALLLTGSWWNLLLGLVEIVPIGMLLHLRWFSKNMARYRLSEFSNENEQKVFAKYPNVPVYGSIRDLPSDLKVTTPSLPKD